MISLSYLDGSRKEQLRDYIKQIESNIEDNIMSQGDCSDQLKSFFDFKIKENKPKVRSYLAEEDNMNFLYFTRLS